MPLAPPGRRSSACTASSRRWPGRWRRRRRRPDSATCRPRAARCPAACPTSCARCASAGCSPATSPPARPTAARARRSPRRAPSTTALHDRELGRRGRAGPGPGILGSASALGHGGMVALDSAHAALALGCEVLVVARMSSADPRDAPPRPLPSHAAPCSSCCCARAVAAAAARRAPTSTLAPAGIWRAAPRVDLDGYRASGLPDADDGALAGRGPPLLRGRPGGRHGARARRSRRDERALRAIGGPRRCGRAKIASVRRRPLPLRRRRGGRARDRSATPARSRSSPTTTSTSGWSASRASRSGDPALLEIPAGKLDVRGRAAARHRQARAGRGDRQGGRALGAPDVLLTSPGFTDERIHVYLATGLRDAPSAATPTRTSGSRSSRGRSTVSTRRSPSARTPSRWSGCCSCGGAGTAAGHLVNGTRRAPAREVGRAGESCPAWPSAPGRRQLTEHLVLDFLAYLEFERGLSRNTLDAYRSDLLQLGAYLDRQRASTRCRPSTPSWPASSPSWPRAGAERPPVSPATLQRKTACIRSFFRHLRREELLDGDPTAQLHAPRESRRLPHVLRRDEVKRLLEQPQRHRARPPCATARCWRSCTPAACAPRRRSASSSPTSTWRPAFCAPGARAPRSGIVPMGTEAIRSRRGLSAPRAPGARGRRAPTGGLSSTSAARAHPPGALQDRPAPRPRPPASAGG